MLKIIYRYSFILFASLLVIFETIQISKGQWFGDFWEHSAVVKELSRHLAHPNNPIIKTHIAHAFFSPYSICVAIFSIITKLNSIQSLECFAFFNLVFFLIAFYLFCLAIFKENHNITATLGLVFILFFWGREPFAWSGFYDILMLHNDLPYPSTFAISLAFLILSMIAKDQVQKHYYKTLIIIILSAIVFITHPTTAIFLFVGIIALNFTFNNYSLKQCIIKSAIIIVPSLILCLLWPYYHIIDLLFGNNIDFHSDSKVLYSGVLRINWPLLLILPGILLIKRDKVIIFFLTAMSLMALIFLGGYVFKIYGVSRLISTIMMFGQILMGYMVALLIKESRLYGKVYLTILSVSFVTSLYLNRPALYKTLNPFENWSIDYYNKYNFLRNVVGPDDIILSDPKSNWIIPTYNGKVISSIHPIYWINDINQRRMDIKSFFINANSDSTRKTIIQKYQPNYLLIDYTSVHFNYPTIKWLNSIGISVYKGHQLELIKITR
jgi:hypothetical protein